jgi:2-haloacid dehalogenase
VRRAPDAGAPIDFERFEALTFDCYGTLVDWESGILEALRPLLGAAERAADEELLERFGGFESEAEVGVFRPYREVLAEVAHRFGDAYGVHVDDAAADRFARSVGRWPVFRDTVAALRALGGRYRLAIVSNVDDDLLAATARTLGVDWSEVVTAEQLSSYKPGRAHFDEVRRRLGLPTERILHVAQSLFHDIAPAKALGFTCVWVDRRGGKPGSGATPPSSATPDLMVPDLASLVAAIGL